jgi:hypothetical protein
MVGTLLTLLLSGTFAFAQAAGAPATQAPGGLGSPQASSPPQLFNPDNVPSDAPVVTVHGVCPDKTDSAKKDSCQVVITKEQFKTMLAGMSVTSQITTPAAMRTFAESYSQLLAMANAGEKAGAESDPHFQELLRIARLRALAEAYRHSLDEKYGNPSQQEIDAYYQENISKYDSFKVERIIIPSINPGRSPAGRAEYEKKFHQLADDIRERAARGEETQKLQDEAYKALNLPSPPRADLGMKRRGSLPAAIEKDILALKPGEVTKLEAEGSGLNIYKLRSRDTIPVEFVKAEIVRDLHQKNMERAIKAVTGGVHSDFNDQFFGPPSGRGGPMMRPPQPSDPLFPKGFSPATPLSTTSAPGAAPANSNPAVPATNTDPGARKPDPPK